MRNPLGNKTYNPPLFTGLLVFLLVFAITTFVTYQRYLIQKSSEKDEIRRQAERVDNEMKSVLEQGFSSTQSIAFLVENYGVPEDFTKISQLILKTNTNVDALELVDGAGVITHVYPLEGNEVLGFNILRDSIGKPGAIKTIEKGEYFITGPIDLKQGGSGFVCRTPIYNDKEFAGFAAAVIKLSSLLSKIPMDTLDNGDFSYQLSKVNPDGSEEMFLSPQKKTSERMPLSTLFPITMGNGNSM
ncbi:CHASE domain-containing protein [Maribacter litopenaei]|uniref:CHASE domain-containing protein n=1 Tax=Maribacter litopenaei TaxID=2976127 RepID=A0ABY5Y9X3_9FLAO|nr:CHASE domain-containing protein [Maribacter litopenaei]UWX54935.1 CHASE domain-containing protein [Maribacter litopenaei]